MTWLDGCCCCISLRAGTILSGILGMIIGLVTMIVVLLTDIKMQTIIIDTLDSEIVRIILAVNLAMTILISLVLILGALWQNKYLLLPWVVLGIMLVVGMVISIIYTAIRFYIWGDPTTGTLYLIVGLLGNAIFFYLWLVVFSYYQLLKEEGGHGFYAKTRY
ncbi:uncharacterized protein LOC132197644 [Neocloeon triangulifer]|uniref:uncharacterized protein LOC132197644 n=1 Tax=Neocloeon triangulifer TaxID=2078957 RepID=UPI00286F8BDE|nr:uncharacterized protein LOC132197644 [Neocloeon triangulifer]